MRRPALAALVLAALLAGCGTTGPQSVPLSSPKPAPVPPVEAHVARATEIAGEDLKHLLSVCQPQPAVRPSGAVIEQLLQRWIAAPPPEPGQAFDNLYFVGSAAVSAWVLKTSDGLILIDAMNNALEAAALIEGGMRKLGLEPAQIKYIIITHGHGDHYGGAAMLAAKYKSKVVASTIDWNMMEGALEFDSPQWSRPPKRDIEAAHGDIIRLGDTAVALYLTPGHTKGTLSPAFDVKSGPRTHRALLWGGTAFNFGRDLARLDDYIDSSERMQQLARRQAIDVFLSNHPSNDKTLANLEALRAKPAANPYVVGTPVVERAMQVVGECARAQKARFVAPAR
jgi:metallo-beta-lactamase class B